MTRRHKIFLLCIALFAAVWIFVLVANQKPGKWRSFNLLWNKRSPPEGHSNTGMRSVVGIARGSQTKLKSLPISDRSSNVSRQLPTPVLLFASMRTGSSFVGELLGNSRDVFYLFEPGHAMQTTLLKMQGLQFTYDVPGLCINLMTKLFRCDFRGLDFYLEYLSQEPLEVLQRRTPRLYDACVQNGSSNATNCVVTSLMATESCQRSKFVVIKEIRVPDMTTLLPLIKDHVLDLKVIHLVRDPRPVTASRVLALTNKTLTSSNQTFGNFSKDYRDFLSDYCTESAANAKLGRQSPNWKGRYMLLRYEDVASDPTSAAERIYQFLGDTLVPKTVRYWIATNTNVDVANRFSTKRNSSQVYQAWRRTMPFGVAKAIEGARRCREMMEMMGYRLLEDEKHQRNLSRPLY
ncbi:carbohydrate sulfotransferase 3-like [Acanthaster planci]|uniref:Carbohydrate sulfotransferase 3-like n=1 Tax=Acanthaster planci TaxID=133434 RepID=A0A8B7XH81_ACAPL|nr:carbohydrate sulfotransferase 3-like [Acanthaster planci]